MQIRGNRLKPDGQEETVEITVQDKTITDVRVFEEVDKEVPILMPGFIDIHVHGGGGADTMDATTDAFEQITKTHARHGTTGLLLTSVTEAPERIDAVLDTARKYIELQDRQTEQTHRGNAPGGAKVLGVHLEGPFIHPKKAGAQRPDQIIEPNPELAERWFATGLVKMMTLAPERPQASAVASLAQRFGVLASVGHTTADYNEVARGKAAGFRHVTHLCNAMNPLHHRKVGPIGYLVDDADFTADIICDGIHVAGPMVKTLVKAVGAERLMLITDAIRAADMPDGEYDLGGLCVTLRDGACRLEDGTLAGSVLTMSAAVGTVQKLAGISAWAAQTMASYNPAVRLNIPHKGKLSRGFDADIVAMDNSGSVLWTMVGGVKVYQKV